ncbi:MAG: AGE family epimerase/isomerase [Bacteroidota bacterium]
MIFQQSSLSDDATQATTILSKELEQELNRLLAYWQTQMTDEVYGGFYGKRLYDETLVADAPKGVVLNARILWSFSAAYRHTNNQAYLQTANRAFDYLRLHFIDPVYGGVFWSVSFDGKPLDTKKQVYALSFALYAFAEYHRCTFNENAKELAIDLFELIEKYSLDKDLGGYIEAFTREWQLIDDLRLSEKDANEKKTMNTHLHILEAYTNLYRIYKTESLKNAILHLLFVFDRYIIDKNTHHLILFFDENWNRKGSQVSYGHDIEAVWLLSEAAEVINDQHWTTVMQQHAVKIANASMEGLDKDGGMWHEYDPATHHLVKEKHWWPQAEAMVGFLHAWQISADHKFFEQVFLTWQFIKKYILDIKNGEWVWGVLNDSSLIASEDKAGFWKCPYHNSRACMEVIERIEKRVHS